MYNIVASTVWGRGQLVGVLWEPQKSDYARVTGSGQLLYC